MTTNNHTPIATGAAANASTFNTPLGSLDAAIGDETALTTTAKTSVVAAINELDAGKLESGASAALIANTPAGNIAAVTVQAAINELDTEKQPLDADLTAIAAISPSNDDLIQRKAGAWTNRTMAELKTDLVLTAANVANVAAGTIAAVTVQAAIDELDSDKAALVHTHTVSAITDQSNWKLDNFGTADDNTDLNATTTNHGLLAKLSGVAGYFMDGMGAWARAIVGVKYKGSATMDGKYINFLGSAVTSAAYNALTDSVDVTITGGSGAGATALADLVDDVDITPASILDNDILSYDLASGKWINTSNSGHIIEDEGTPVTSRTSLNFVGTGVAVADAGGKSVVTIPRYDDGWIPATGTWSYSSVDSPTSVISVNADMTGIIGVGMKIKLTQTTAKYFIVTAVGEFSGGNTLITVYGGSTPYTVANEAITLPHYSTMKAPFGFPASPLLWSVIVTDTTQRVQATPTSNTYYNLGSVSISVPIGLWRLGYSVVVQISDNPSTVLAVVTTLSTADDSITNSEFNVKTQINMASGNLIYAGAHKASNIKSSAAKTSWYILTGASGVTVDNIYNMNASSTLVITAECAYL